MKNLFTLISQNRLARTRTTAKIVTVPMDNTTNNSLDKAAAMEVEDSSSPNNKRGTGEKTPTLQKKSRNSTKLVNTTPRPHHFWYGFSMMEALARERGDQPYEAFPICDMLEMGYLKNEAVNCKLPRSHFQGSLRLYGQTHKLTRQLGNTITSHKSHLMWRLTMLKAMLWYTRLYYIFQSQRRTIPALLLSRWPLKDSRV